MFAPGVVIYEKRSRWEAALKRAPGSERIQFRICRLAAEVRPALERMPGSVLILDLDAAPAECLRLIAAAAELTPRVQIVAVGSPAVDELEWPVRELGALAYFPGSVSGDELGRFCERQFRLGEPGPREPGTPAGGVP